MKAITNGQEVTAIVQGVPGVKCRVEEVNEDRVKVFVPDSGDGYYTHLRHEHIDAQDAPEGTKPPKGAKPAKPKAAKLKK